MTEDTDVQPSVVMVGAGKIARGYVAHLLYLAGIPVIFIESNTELVELLNRRGRYTVHVLGAPDKKTTISRFRALHVDDPAARLAFVGAAAAFVSVGGANLSSVGPLLAAGLQARRAAKDGPLNIVLCENWHRPAEFLKTQLRSLLVGVDRQYLETEVGIAEATILRSCIEPTPEQRQEDPLAIQAQDYWELQIDADALIADLPPVPGIVPVNDFDGALERKLYTYNAVNATISYLGVLRGHRLLKEAADDPTILAVVRGVQDEINPALAAKQGFDLAAQQVFAAGALRKFQERLIVDPLERQVRDPIRKLGRHDRLVGAAELVLEFGGEPRHLALAIAAALRYRNPNDPSAERLQQMIADDGLDEVLRRICGIDPTGPLAGLIRESDEELDRVIST